MYDLYMAKGIIPQTKETKTKSVHFRSNSDARSDRQLTNAEMQRKIEKDMIIAKHLGGNDYSKINNKSNLISSAHKTIAGFNYKPSMIPKLTMLQSNFSELTGSTNLIDQSNPNLAKTMMEVSLIKNYWFSFQNYYQMVK